MAIDPKGADLKKFLAEDPGGPVVMLNLLRFKAQAEGDDAGVSGAAVRDASTSSRKPPNASARTGRSRTASVKRAFSTSGAGIAA